MTAASICEVQPGVGNALNGGFFDSSFGGTDYSQQAAAQASGTATSATTTVTATTGIFTLAMVGNCITDGTTFVIITAFTSSLIVTVDTAPSWTAASIKVGGAQSSAINVASKIVPGNQIWIKLGTDSTSGSPSFTAGTLSANVTITGYYQTRGDLTTTGTYAATHTSNGFLDTSKMPTMSGFTTVTFGAFTRVEGIILSYSRNSSGVTGANVMWRCKIANGSNGTSAVAVTINSLTATIEDCDLSSSGGNASNGVVQTNQTGYYISDCRITSALGAGLTSIGGLTALHCVFYNFASGQSVIAMESSNASPFIMVKGCTFYNCLGICVSIGNAALTNPRINLFDNQVTGCGTFANNQRSGTNRATLFAANNRIRNTTTTYMGWLNIADNGAAPGDVVTTQTDAAEYISASSSPPDVHLTAAAAGRGNGLIPYRDIGAFQTRAAMVRGISDGVRD